MKNRRKILSSTLVVSFFTMCSRVLGFLRDMLMAYWFGTSPAKSAFDVAFRMPNLFRAIIGEGALNAAFIPIYSEALSKEDKQRSNEVLGQIFSFIGMLLLVITTIGMTISLLGLHFTDSASQWHLIFSLLRIIFPYVFFICMVALCSGIYYTHGTFWLPAMTPGLLNIVWILFILFIVPKVKDSSKIYVVAWGILSAGIIQLIFQIPFLFSKVGRFPLRLNLKDIYVKRFIKLLMPGVFGMGIIQINFFITTCLSVTIGTWAPAALSYADRLIYLPLGIIATALGSVLLPAYSKMAVNSDNDDIVDTLSTSIRGVAFVMLPIVMTLIAMGAPIISWVYQWHGGKFNSQSEIYTLRAVIALSPGLIFFSIYKVLVPVFYALKDTKTPMKVSSCMVFVSLFLNILSIKLLPAGYEHAGMAFAVVLTSLLNCAVLSLLLKNRLKSIKIISDIKIILKFVIAVIFAGIVMFYGYRTMSSLKLNINYKVLELIKIVLSEALAIPVYLFFSLLFNRRDTLRIIAKIFNRQNVSI